MRRNSNEKKLMKMDTLYKNLFGLVVLALFLSPAVSAAGPSAVNLGAAGSFAILAKSGISTTGTTSVTGDIGVSPIDSTAITGFGLILDPSAQFATSSLVNGKIYAANYAPPTPAAMTTAVGDMQIAYTDAAGRTNPTATELGAGNIGGMTIAPGLYKWGTGVTIPTGTTLSGGPNDVWIFQIAQTLNVGDGAIIALSGGAQPQNIFWQVAGQATLGTTSDFKGIILSQTAVVMNTGAKLNGRALAQTAVTLDADAVTAPTGSAMPVPTPTPTPQPIATNNSSAPTSTGSAMPAQATQPTATQSTSTSASDNPIIIPTPSSQPAVSSSQAQIAQNLALGLPAGIAASAATPAPTTVPVAQPTTSTTQPTAQQPTSTPIPAEPATPTPAPKPTATPTPPAAPTATSTPTTTNGASTIPGANLQTFVAAAIVVLLGAGLYYYFRVMKK